MMGRHVADSPVDTDRLSPWVRSHLDEPRHIAGVPHMLSREGGRELAAIERDERAAYAEATGYRMHDGHAYAKCSVAPVTEASVVAPLVERKRANLAAEYRVYGIDPALAAILDELNETDTRHDPALAWAVNNAAKPEGRATLLDHDRAVKARRAREPKRFIIRKVAPGVWVARDQARPVWQLTQRTHDDVVIALMLLAHRGILPDEWDGVVSVRLRRPEVDDLDDIDEWEV